MNTDKLQQLWKTYLDAYSDVPADERERLLRQSVSDDVVFTGPKEEDQGFDKLVEHIGQFQKKSPGAYFVSSKLLTQHGQLLSEWTLYKKDGTKIATGHTYARLNDQGRLAHLAGFFQV
jgi:hypothetical protein